MYEYRAKVIDVYDGDTFRANVDLGFDVWMNAISFRMYGINAPEMRGLSKAAGTVTRDRLRELIMGKTVTIKTHKDKQEKYGRWLADVFLESGTYVNDMLVTEQLAMPFMTDANT